MNHDQDEPSTSGIKVPCEKFDEKKGSTIVPQVLETVFDKPRTPSLVKDSERKTRFSRSGSVTFEEKSSIIFSPGIEVEESTIFEDPILEIEESQKEKLYKISRDLDKADVHELLANKKAEDFQDASDNLTELEEPKEHI